MAIMRATKKELVQERLTSVGKPEKSSLIESLTLAVRDVQLDSGKPAKEIEVGLGDQEASLTLRHATGSEYLRNAVGGFATGSAAGTVGHVLMAIKADSPIEIWSLLESTGLGGLIGASLGLGATPISNLEVGER